jgi:ATP-dependent Clp protease ATP-binding subunit ClpC
MNNQNKNEIKQLMNLIGIKKALIVEGNVDDIYELNGKYINIHSLLNEIFSEKGYHKRFKYDKYSGFNRLIDEIGNEQQKFSTSLELFSQLQTILADDGELVGVVVDYTNYIFSPEANSEEDQLALTAFEKTLKESNLDITEISNLKSCAVFVAKQINQLPPEMYLNNSDVAILTLPKPNRFERKKFINTVRAKLNNIIDITESLETFIDYTEGWTLKEISHFVRYVSNQKMPEEFKATINNYLYGNSVSPWQELNYEKVKNLESYLNQRVIGQNEVAAKVSNVIVKASLGLSGITFSEVQTKPKGTLFFVGPTGVGKTELAKALTKFLFGDESNLIRFDMSEYSSENADQKLIGAPPGYVGYDAGGQLTNAIKEKPFSVVLFDEIEKANPKIFDKFLQILEDGRLTDNTGKTVSFSETIIIFTSNIGAASVDSNQSREKISSDFISEVQKYFTFELNRPEILGRIGNNIIPFSFISDASFQSKIVEQKVNRIVASLHEKYNSTIDVIWTPELTQHLSKDADIKRGGRDILNSLELNFVDPLSKFMFENNSVMNSGSRIEVTFDGELKFKIK